MRCSQGHSGASLEEEAAALLEGLRELGSEIDLAQMWTSAYGIMEKEIIQQHGLEGKNSQGGRFTQRWWRSKCYHREGQIM